jgi:hypothetical protein
MPWVMEEAVFMYAMRTDKNIPYNVRSAACLSARLTARPPGQPGWFRGWMDGWLRLKEEVK